MKGKRITDKIDIIFVKHDLSYRFQSVSTILNVSQLKYKNSKYKFVCQLIWFTFFVFFFLHILKKNGKFSKYIRSNAHCKYFKCLHSTYMLCIKNSTNSNHRQT